MHDWIPCVQIDVTERADEGHLFGTGRASGSPTALRHGTWRLEMHDPSVVSLEPYLAEHVRDALDRDKRTCGFDIDVAVDDGVIRLGGTVLTQERRVLVEQVVRELLPDRAVRNDLLVGELAEPTRAEHLA
jgi:hypothetical protein